MIAWKQVQISDYEVDIAFARYADDIGFLLEEARQEYEYLTLNHLSLWVSVCSCRVQAPHHVPSNECHRHRDLAWLLAPGVSGVQTEAGQEGGSQPDVNPTIADCGGRHWK